MIRLHRFPVDGVEACLEASLSLSRSEDISGEELHGPANMSTNRRRLIRFYTSRKLSLDIQIRQLRKENAPQILTMEYIQ